MMQTNDPLPQQPTYDQPAPQLPVSQKNGTNTTLIVVVSVLLTGLITGTSVYLWQKSAVDQNTSKLPQQPVVQENLPIIINEETSTQPIDPVKPPVAEEGPTANWSTYTNDNYDFKFSYPQDWVFGPGYGQAYLFQATLIMKDPTQQPFVMPGDTSTTPYYQVLVSVLDNPTNLSAKEYYLKDYAVESKSEAASGLEEVQISGETGIKYQEASAPSSGMATTVSVSHNNKIYQLSYGALAHETTHNKYLETFNQIVESFIFMN